MPLQISISLKFYDDLKEHGAEGVRKEEVVVFLWCLSSPSLPLSLPPSSFLPLSLPLPSFWRESTDPTSSPPRVVMIFQSSSTTIASLKTKVVCTCIVCMYVCMYVCVYICTCICICVCMYVCSGTPTCVRCRDILSSL